MLIYVRGICYMEGLQCGKIYKDVNGRQYQIILSAYDEERQVDIEI